MVNIIDYGKLFLWPDQPGKSFVTYTAKPQNRKYPALLCCIYMQKKLIAYKTCELNL